MHQYLGLIPERLLPIKVETLGPFIFVNLDQDSDSLLETIGKLPGSIDLNGISRQNWQAEQWFECQSNWKLAGRAFYDLESLNENLSIDEHSNSNHHILANLPLPKLNNTPLSAIDKSKIFWLFPNLLVISSADYTFSVILQPTSMGECLLRVCTYDEYENKAIEEQIPKDVQQYIETVLARAESCQQKTDKLTRPGAPELTEEMIPLEKNIAGYVFQQYITKQIVTEHEYFWNAPLYRINPVA